MLLAYLEHGIKISSLPYSEYWLPLAIGLGIGLTFLVVARSIMGGPPRLPAAPKKHREYDPFTQGSPTDQRKSFRRTGNPVEVQYCLPDCKKNPRLGWVFDRSVGGIGLVTTEAYAPGTVLAVHVIRGGKAVPWVEVQVRTCREADGSDYELGCQFVKTPPWSVLLLFG